MVLPAYGKYTDMVDKKNVAKKAGMAVVAKKLVGSVSKMVVLAGVGAAVIKVLRREQK